MTLTGCQAPSVLWYHMLFSLQPQEWLPFLSVFLDGETEAQGFWMTSTRSTLARGAAGLWTTQHSPTVFMCIHRAVLPLRQQEKGPQERTETWQDKSPLGLRELLFMMIMYSCIKCD